MRIANYLRPDCVALRQRADSLTGAVQQMVTLLNGTDNLTDTAVFAVMIAAPAEANDLHVQVLAELATLFLDTDFCACLRESETPEAFCRAISAREEQDAQEPPSAPSDAAPGTAKPGYQLLAVTACPTGIAHTYLAAEALQQAAQARGLTLKVETNGAAGVNDELTDDEIQAAECVIVAVDRSIPLARFVGKRLVYASAGDAVRDADRLLEKAVSGKAPVYRGGHAFRTSDWKELGREYYGHLMSGISHMLPFVVAGGVMLALSLLLQHLFGRSDITTMMTNVGNAAFRMMYPVLAAFIAYSIADRPGFMPGLMGGYLAQLGTTTAPRLGWISSGFWGAIVAGFAAGLAVRLLNYLFRRIPQELDHIKTGLLVPLLSLLFVGALMVMAINPPLGRFNAWLSIQLDGMQGGSRLVLGTLLGGMMATDYGGPINKAAYVSGTLALVDGRCHGGRHDSAAGHWAGLPAVPDAVHQHRALLCAADPADGRDLRDRGCAAVCTARPAAGQPRLHRRQCTGRVHNDFAGLRVSRAARRVVFAAGHGKPAGLSDCAGCRHPDHGPAAGHAEKAAEALIFALLFVFFSSLIQIVFT